ncbi:MAG: hypothetical protein AAF639_44130 [Chloroflexota bacterium]
MNRRTFIIGSIALVTATWAGLSPEEALARGGRGGGGRGGGGRSGGSRSSSSRSTGRGFFGWGSSSSTNSSPTSGYTQSNRSSNDTATNNSQNAHTTRNNSINDAPTPQSPYTGGGRVRGSGGSGSNTGSNSGATPTPTPRPGPVLPPTSQASKNMTRWSQYMARQFSQTNPTGNTRRLYNSYIPMGMECKLYTHNGYWTRTKNKLYNLDCYHMGEFSRIQVNGTAALGLSPDYHGADSPLTFYGSGAWPK